ncbi:MAG: ComEC/Rec2 family competence protein [Microbacteriaceae bacterium]|nr:ComEC/Rec2 family competence protein [Microbacteriaceae bacterium]
MTLDTQSPARAVGADLRLAVPAAVVWIAVAVAIGAPSASAPMAVAGWVLAGLLIGVGRATRRPSAAIAALALGLAALGVTAATASAPHRQPPALLEAAQAGRFISAEATTTQTVLPGSESFTVDLASISIGPEAIAVSAPARVFGAAPDGELGIGTRIRVTGTVAATPPQDRVAFLVFASSPPLTVVGPPPGLDWANALRAAFREAAAELPGDGGALLPGLSIGDTSAVGEELDAAMKTSSLSHLTAVSGANCVVVIGIVMLAGAAVGVPRVWRIGASIAVLGGFVVLVTPEPSVLRAGTMALIVLVSLAGGRPVRGLPVLALAVIGLLVADPWLARSYGFALSVLATAGLLLLAGPLTGALGRWIPVPIAAVIAIPFAAQLACQSVLILLEPSIPSYGVLANALAGPAAPAGTVLGLLACLLLPVAPGLGVLVSQLAWVPSAWIAAVAQFFSGLPGSRLPWLDGVFGAVLLALLSVLIVVALGDRADHPVRRRVAASVIAIVAVGALGASTGTTARTWLTRPQDWQYAQCDVGQGDAVLVRSAGETALIDTGPDPERLERCFGALGIRRVDLLVLTHFDLDHVGGAGALVGRADRVLIGPSDGPDADELVEVLRAGGARVDEVSGGATGTLGELRWNVLWPRSPLRGIEPGNAASIAIAFDGVATGAAGCGCLSSIFLGDLDDQAQALLSATGRVRPVDIVKVAHHGSGDQDGRLYARLRATVGLIGVGEENTYGHPTREALDLLAAAGTVPARSDLLGLVLLSPGDNGGARQWSERG